jgi:hypothetical protein
MPHSPNFTNAQYQSDLEFGLNAEIILKNTLENEFGLLNQLDKYNPFDYENDDYLIELKSRRINHNKYPTAMVNLSKILKTNNSNKNRVIVFNYLDGLYKWIVDDNYNAGIGGRNDRGLDEYSEMAYIDINNLTLITAV